MKYCAAIFDLDGTLLDSMALWENIAPDFLRRHGVEAPPDLNKTLGAMGVKQARRYLKEHYQLPMSYEEIAADIEGVLHDFYFGDPQLKPGAKEFLLALKAKRIPCCVATATDTPLVEAALNHCGIADLLPGGVISCSALHTSKSKPDIFFAAMKTLGAFVPAETIVFEDALYAATTAHAAGFPLGIIVDPTEPGQDALRQMATWYFRNWAEFPLDELI